MPFCAILLLYCLLICPLLCDQCGYQPNIVTRIIGGSEAANGSWPWMVSLRAVGYGHLCGGVLIHSKYALTAGHCTYLFLSTQYEVHVGIHYINETNVFSPVTRIHRHPLYISTIEESLRVYDYAVLELANPIDTRKFNPICLPTPSGIMDTSFGENVTTLGWGVQSGNATELAYTLQQVTIKLLNPLTSDCQASHLLNESLQLCAGTLEGGQGTCGSDSGGPLMALEDGRWYVIGLTSYAWGCGLPSSPTIFLRISAYIEWMRENIPELFMEISTIATSTIINRSNETTTTNRSNKEPDKRPLIAGIVCGSVFGVVCLILFLIGQWHVFTKAGERGWKAIIPIYSFSVCLKLIGHNPWWTLLLCVPVLNIIVIGIVWFKLGRLFKQSCLFITGMILIPPVFWLILGLNRSKYSLQRQGKTFPANESKHNGNYAYSSDNNHVHQISETVTK